MQILAESKNYIVFHEYEMVILKIKKLEKEILIGDFYGEPQMAVISQQETYCAICGCGVIIYYLQPPFIEYEYHKKISQWKEWGREKQEIWVKSIKCIDNHILQIKTESEECININPYNLIEERNNQFAVTSFSPMLYDKNIYQIYMILKESKCSIEEIKAFSKLCNINYIQSKNRLKNKRNMIGEGNAYWVRDILEKLMQYNIDYEIVPPYCHKI